MSDPARIVIIGGGYSGIEVAKRLSKKFNKTKAKVTIIDRNPFHTLMTELHEVAGWRSGPESVMVSFERIFPGDKVEVVLDSVQTVDFERKSVKGSIAEYPYDFLVLGTGSEPEFFGIPGVEENSFKLWSLDDALAVREHAAAMFLAASRETNPEARKEMLTFAVAGAGFTGIEMAGEFAEECDRMCELYHLDKSEARVIVVEALPAMLTMLDEKLREKAEIFVKRLGIELMLNAPIVGAEPGMIKIKDGRLIKARTFVWTCGVMGSAFAGNLDLTKGRCTNIECPHSRGGTCSKKICEFKTARAGAFVKGKRGRILVDEGMRSVDYPSVYVAGDALWHLENGRPLPQIVETSLQTGETVAHNISVDLKGGGERKAFKSDYHGFMVSIGSRFAVANLKMPWFTVPLMALVGLLGGYVLTSLVVTIVKHWNFAAGFTSPWNFLALATAMIAGVGMAILAKTSVFSMGMKHLINMHYLWGITGFNGVFNYLRHQFFRRDDGRSFWPGRLVAPRVQGLWVVLLRMFTGAMWFIEGLGKLSWLSPKNSGWVNRLLFGIADTSADANAAASEGAEAVAAVDPATLLAQAKAAATSAGGLFLPPVVAKPTALYKWILKIFIGDGSHPWQLFFAYCFRMVIVLGEVGIGLALFGGAFTFLASGVSLILCVMFLISGMATREIFWYLCAGLVLLGASGKAAGLDNWIIPFIDRLWRGSKLGRATKLYPDEPLTKRKR